MIIGEPSIWVTHRLPILYGTITLILLITAAVVIRRIRRAVAKERGAVRREESLREFPRPGRTKPDGEVA
jgi:hypothetical protein